MIKIIIAFVAVILMMTACQIGGYEIRKMPESESLRESEKQTQIKDELMSNCESDFKKYVDISESKFSIKIYTLETQKVSDTQSIDEFSEIWSSTANKDIELDDIEKQFSYRYERPKLDFPIVLFATQFKGNRAQIPLIIACGNDGKIMENSRNTLLNFGQLLAIQ